MLSNLLAGSAAAIGLGVALGVVVLAALAACFLLYRHGKKTGIALQEQRDRETVGSAKEVAERLVEDAKAECKNLRKEASIEAKEEMHRLRSDFEKESRDRRAELQKSEQRIMQREELLDKKENQLDKKNEQVDNQIKNLQRKEAEIAEKANEVDQAHEKMLAEIEKVSQMTRDEAKTLLIDAMKDDAQKDAAVLVREIEAEATQSADKKAKEIITLAIQKCAADQVSDVTVSVVPLPNDDMKGRIIGREGRNIRALENATGIDLIIDDTPEVVILSGFDPIRREVARVALEKLIVDGRIHPARIEEVVEKVKKDVENQIKEAGEAAVFDAGIYGLHPELVKLLGRLKFRTSYGQNVLKHSLEVAFLAGTMAGELGADVALAKRAGLLHDIGKAVDFEVEGTHIQIGADLAKKYRENKEVVNAIMAHHGDVEPLTLEAVLVAAADAISSARPGARRESLDNYVKRLEKLEEIANSFEGVDNSYAIQAGREVRIIVKPDKVDDQHTVFLAKDIAKKIEAELDYPGTIKVNVIREFRGTEYAK